VFCQLLNCRVPRVYPTFAILAIVAVLAEHKINNLRVLNTWGRSESRRPRHSFQSSWADFIETTEGHKKGTFRALFVPLFQRPAVSYPATSAPPDCRVATSWRHTTVVVQHYGGRFTRLGFREKGRAARLVGDHPKANATRRSCVITITRGSRPCGRNWNAPCNLLGMRRRR
jgi:hypothetical protein